MARGLGLQDGRKKHWYWAENEVIDDYGQKLGIAGVAVYHALARRCDGRTRQVRVSHAWLMKALSTSRSTIIRALRVIEELRLIHRESGQEKGAWSLYTLLNVPRRKSSDSAPLFEGLGGVSNRHTPHEKPRKQRRKSTSSTTGKEGVCPIDTPGCVPQTQGCVSQTQGCVTGSVAYKEVSRLSSKLNTKTSAKTAGAVVRRGDEGAELPPVTAESPPQRAGPAKDLEAFAPRKPEADPLGSSMLRRQITDEIDRQYLRANRVPCPWGNKLAFKRLQEAVQSAPEWLEGEWLNCVRNYYASDPERYNRGAPPEAVIPRLKEFIGGPRARWGGTLNGNGSKTRVSAVDERAARNRETLQRESEAIRRAFANGGTVALPDPPGAPAGRAGRDAGAVRAMSARVSRGGG